MDSCKQDDLPKNQNEGNLTSNSDLNIPSNEVTNNSQESDKDKIGQVSWKDLGLTDTLCDACERLKWQTPTKIQIETIPLGLQKKDVIGLAETGSGKTAAFVLPILQALLYEDLQRYFALILTPTRELAEQIVEQIDSLTFGLNIETLAVIGGMDVVQQAINIALRPHIIVATPGRLMEHIETLKGFSLSPLKYLVLDEADRILNLDFEVEVNKILKVIPRKRCTMLFSATMTKKVKKLQRACLRNPISVEVCDKYKTVDTLEQYYILVPFHLKDAYLVQILRELDGKNFNHKSFMIFCSTCARTLLTALILRNLGFTAIPLHGKMDQGKRLEALAKFKAKNRSILISTDVLSRGLDIPHVDCVINFDVPNQNKDYIHRVGRTARAGRSGVAITLFTQLEIDLYQNIEKLIGKSLKSFKIEETNIENLKERIEEARSDANRQVSIINLKNRKRYNNQIDDGDTEKSLGFRKRLKIVNKKK